MGWRGALRSINAATRQMEREAERRHRQRQKELATAEAADAVDDWEEHIKGLKSLHCRVPKAIDWNFLAKMPPIPEPRPDISRTKVARDRLDNFSPNWRDRFRPGGSERRKKSLIQALENSKNLDREQHQVKIEKYLHERNEKEAERAFAEKVINRDPKSLLSVINEKSSLASVAGIGENIDFRIYDSGELHAILASHGDDLVPDFRRKQLASGRLTESKMPRGEFNEIYQDYIASAAFSVAGEIFALLPINEVYVTCKCEILNSKNGHLELTPILSVRFVRQTFERLNMQQIDPSDALGNFSHNMEFKRTSGFSPIEPLIEL
jgi:hypothetical protein